jgi:hypothetical protein
MTTPADARTRAQQIVEDWYQTNPTTTDALVDAIAAALAAGGGMSDDLDLDELERLARDVKQRWPWVVSPAAGSIYLGEGSDESGVAYFARMQWCRWRDDDSDSVEDDDTRNRQYAAYLAAVSPTTILALVARVREAERMRDVREALMPGPHQHTWWWSTNNVTEQGVPLWAACQCGLTYEAFLNQGAAEGKGEP